MSVRRTIVLLTLFVVHANAFASDQDRRNFTPVIEEMDGAYERYSLEARAYADGVLDVRLTKPDGSPLFHSTYPVVKADGNYVEWTYHSDPPLRRSALLEAGVIPTLRGMAFAARDIARMAARGLTPETGSGRPGDVRSDDTWGCDLPEYADIECTSRGNCCDTHDECYWAYDCSYWSWLGISNLACEACNWAVVLCITTGTGSTGEPSACCSLWNCGTERCGGTFWNDPQCLPAVELPLETWPIDQDPLYGYPGDPGSGGMYAWYNPYTGTIVETYGGKCCFPDGTCISCG